MKKVIATTTLALFISVSLAQTHKKTYGPKAKNNKVWINKGVKSEVHTNSNERVTGGVAKNNKVWATNYKNSKTTKVVGNSDKQGLQGPAAKNYKYSKKRVTGNKK